MAETAHNSSLYILVFTDRRLIKIGKADDVHNRYLTLKRWWGQADLSASYELTTTRNMVFRLEKALHVLLHAYSAKADVGDGRTEMFTINGLESAIDLLNIFVATGANCSRIKKGIVVPKISDGISRRDREADRINEAQKIISQFGATDGVSLKLLLTERKLTGSRHAQLLLIALEGLAEGVGHIKISRAELSAILKCSEATVKRAIAELKNLGLLMVDQIGGMGNENTYSVDF